MERSVYTPGAGHLPEVLAGRDELLHSLRVRLNETAMVGRRRAQDVIFTGVRGVGKTALLTVYRRAAEQQGFEVIYHQAVKDRPGFVEAILKQAEQRLEEGSGPWTRARRALERVAGVSVGIAGASAGVSFRDRPAAGSVFPEQLADALALLATEVRKDAPHGGVTLIVDEVQVAGPQDLTLLAATLHQLNVQHPEAAVSFAGSGLPTVPGDLRAAGVTHPDRLFTIEEIPPELTQDEALYAVIEPARRAGVTWQPEAAELVVDAASRYPAHVQLFADETWLAAPGPSVITVADAQTGQVAAENRIARQSLSPRVNELSGRKLEYLTAIALNGGSAPVGAVAATLNKRLPELSWLREELIRDGDIYSPNRGHVALAVPAFARFLLGRYEDARRHSDTALLSLEDMRRNQAAHQARALSAGGHPPPRALPAPPGHRAGPTPPPPPVPGSTPPGPRPGPRR